MTGYDAALAVAKTESERNRLRDLRLALNIPPDSPEWGFYGILAPLFGREAEEARAAGEKRLGEAVEAVAEAVALLRSEASRVSPASTSAPGFAAIERIESRMGEIEERLGQVPTVRMIEPLFVRSNDDPIAAPARDLTVFVIALLASVAVVTIASAPILRSPVVLVAAFVLGVSAALGYLWLEPLISPVIERHRRVRR